MIYSLADNITSPLGNTSEENLQAVLQGKSALKVHTNLFPSVDPFCASLFPERIDFVTLCLRSARAAVSQAGIDAASARVVFVVSTTKGDNLDLVTPARRIANAFNNPNEPIVVSNACVSGVCAQIVAARLLESGNYDTAVVIGCDVQSQFIVSGFQSFKALSPEPCRPFDAQRIGLNLGEAAATMVLTTKWDGKTAWTLASGAIRNDANHISGPSRTGEGSFRCLNHVMNSRSFVTDVTNVTDVTDTVGDMQHTEALTPDDITCVSVHGTATAYNDEMESIALSRAGLSQTPVSALKGYFGHTMGAAGVLETILTLHALEQGVVLPSRGFETQGTTYSVNLSSETRTLSDVKQPQFIKLLSGFGGCNAAVRWSKCPDMQKPVEQRPCEVLAELTLTEQDNLVALYREHVGDYPKFFKMDPLSRLGFVAAEMLLKQYGMPLGEHTNVVFANRSASIANDRMFCETIENPETYFPSPAVFVYTLPNIVTGEIAIRRHFLGETMFYVLDSEEAFEALKPTLLPNGITLAAWAECTDKTHYFIHIQLIKK